MTFSPGVYVVIGLLLALVTLVALVALNSLRSKPAAPATFDIGGLAEMVAGVRRQLAALEEDTEHRFKVLHGRVTRYLERGDQLELNEEGEPANQAAVLTALARSIPAEPPEPADALAEARARRIRRR
jgi:hypothetical protein